MRHFIRQQILNIDLKGSESEGFVLQQQLPDLFNSKVLPAIEEVLDHCSPSESHLIIDRLEIDAGTIDLARLDQDLASVVAAELRKSIQKVYVKPGLPVDNPAKKGAFIRHDQEKLWEVFIYFLIKGSLPWAYQLPEGKSLEVVFSELLFKDDKGGDSLVPAAKIMEVFKTTGAAKRLTLQFSAEFVQMVLSKVAPRVLNVYHELEVLMDEPDHLPNLSENVSFTPEIRERMKRIILEKTLILSSSAVNISKVEIVKLVLIELESQKDPARFGLNVFEAILSDDQTILNQLNIKNIDKTAVVDENMPQVSVTAMAGETTVQEVTEGIFIDNAGLVLLHPFIYRFFEHLGIANEDELFQPDRALCMLHYLVTGQAEAPEYELVFPKLLCGIPLSMPVPLLIEISEPEKSEASSLLDAVIHHWEALGNTSPDGLRGNFLVRPGKLSQKEDGDWLLQVEPRDYDVLLDRLPWGISMIRLPWMKTMLWVEWR